jgi:anthranilate synthase component 1
MSGFFDSISRRNRYVETTLEEIKQLAQDGRYQTARQPRDLSDIAHDRGAAHSQERLTHCFLLESVADHEKWGRYTFLGYDPKLEITCQDGNMRLGSVAFETSDPGKYIKQIVEEHRSARIPGLPPFTGGLVGYFSYDYLKYSEPTLHLDAEDTEGFHDVDLMLFDKVIAFDNFRQKIVLCVNISLKNAETEYHRAELELKQMAALLREAVPAPDERGHLTSEFRALFDEETFCGMVEQAKHHILRGGYLPDRAFQSPGGGVRGNATQRLSRIAHGESLPYMFYFSSCDMEVAALRGDARQARRRRAEHFPLAGTRRAASRRRKTSRWNVSARRSERNSQSTTCSSTSAATSSVESALWQCKGGAISLDRALFRM